MAQIPSPYVFRHVTTSDGLASNKVTGIVRDDKGFMWISTFNGLQRYDGYSFSTWHHDPADTSSLSTDGSICLLKDLDNNLWLSSWPWGFTIFNPLSGKSSRVFDPSIVDAIAACLDKEGNVWLISQGALEEYERSSHRLISFTRLLPAGINLQKTIFYDPLTENIYINSYNYGICVFRRKEQQFYYRQHNPRHIPILDQSDLVGSLFLDRDNYFWLYTTSGKLLRTKPDSGGVLSYDLRDTAYLRHNPAKLRIQTMMQDRKGTVWFASGTGLLYCPRGDSLLQIVPEKIEDGNGLHSDGEIHCLTEDPEGNIWVGTDKGVNIFNPGRQKFVSVGVGPSPQPTGRKYSIGSFLERDNGDIWVAAFDGGIFVFDKNLRFKHRFTGDKNLPGNSPEPTHENVWSLLPLPGGRTIIGSQHGWISSYDPVTGLFNNRQPPGLRRLTISNMIAGRDNTVWMALYHGLGKWDVQKDSFTAYMRFIPYRGDTGSIAIDLMEDRDNKLWVATIDHGLQEFDPSTEKFLQADTPEVDRPAHISSSALQSIINLGDSGMAMGTPDAGINIYNKPSGRFTYITAADGLPSNNVTALYYHAPNNLWAATEQGLCRIDLTTRHITTYGAEDGIMGNDFSDLLRFYRLRNGHVLAGFKGGFLSFNPDSLFSRDPPQNVTITGIRVFEQPLSVDSILHGSDTAIFSHRQNFISIQYASLSYTEPDRIRYYYQLEGVDQDWVNAGRGRNASYTDLPGGHYLFKVKCENNDYVPCLQQTSFYIIIVPPFWRTGWFFALVIAAVLALLYGIYRYRIGQILELQRVRNKISQDLHDDLGATLSSIAVLSEIARNAIQRGLPQQSFPMLEKISTYSRDMVDKMRDIVWAINPSNDSMDSMIKRLNAYGTEACANRGIIFRLQLKDDFVNLPVAMSTRKNIYFICKEAMHNATMHAGCNELSVFFDTAAGYIVITIRDDGKGFDRNGETAGNGLNNMQSRAEEIGASLEILPGTTGTTIKLSLVVPKNRR